MAMLAQATLAALSIQAQVPFQNLNFESATLSPVTVNGSPPVYVPVSCALPGWSAYLGTSQQTQVIQNVYGHGQAIVAILGPNYPAAGWPPGLFNAGVIDGNYSVLLQSGVDPTTGDVEGVSIAQTGTVPQGFQSLEFEAWQPLATEFSISFNGVNLSPFVLGTGANYTLYGVNISPFVGQTGSLEFTADYNATGGASWLGLDDIAFCTQAVPEPSPLIMTGIGGLLVALCRRFVPKRP